MNVGKFVVGQTYYCFGYGERGAVVSTWTYDGLIETESCSSKSCDVPYHFYQFTLHGSDPQHPQSARIPSLKQANRTRLTWPEFLARMKAEPADPIGNWVVTAVERPQ